MEKKESSDKDLIGLTREEVEWVLNEEGTRFRIDFVQGEYQPKDKTYDRDRVNLSFQDGKVIATFRG